jgi:hypothetical protein
MMTENQNSSSNHSAATITPPPPPETPVHKTGEMPKPHRRRRRWPWVLLGICLFLVILVLALPSLMCTGPGVRLIEQQINSKIKGHLTIGSLSLGWFSPAQIKDVTLQDSHGAMIARNLTVKTSLSLIHAISNWQDFGKVNIHIGEVKLVTQANGLNIVRALASRAPPTTPAVSASASTKVAPISPAPAALPALNGQVQMTIGKLQWTSPSTPTVNATATTFDVMVNTSGKPLDFTFSTSVATTARPSRPEESLRPPASKATSTAPRQTPAHIALSGKLNVFAANRIVAVNKITGTVNADIQSLNLQSLNPLLAAMGVQLTMAGTLNGHLAAALPAPGQGQASAQLTFAALRLGGKMLKGDSPKLGLVTIPVAAQWNTRHFNLKSAQIENGIASLAMQASGSLPAVMAILHHTPADGGTATIHLTGKADIAALAEEFPHLLGVPADTHFTHGLANWGLDLTLGSKSMAVAARSNALPPLPPVAGRVMFAVNNVSWKSPLYPHARTANADGQITFNTRGRPVHTVLHISVLHGTQAPSMVSLNGALGVFGPQTVLPLTAITGSMDLKISAFYLDYLNPILNRFHAPLQTHGVLSANLQLAAPAAGNGTLTGQLAIADCGFQGSFIKQDNPDLGLVRIPVNVAWQQRNILVHELGVLCQAVSLKLHGRASLNTLQAIAANKPLWGNAHLAASVQADMHLLGADFPNTLHLRQRHAKIESGMVQVTAQLHAQAKSATAAAAISIANVKGQLNGRSFSTNPVLIGLNARRLNSQWHLTLAQIQQAATATGDPAAAPLLTVQVKADPAVVAAYMVSMSADLQPLTNELAQFSSAQSYADSGQWTLAAQVEGVGTPRLSCRMKTEIKNASLVLMPGKPAYTDPDIRIATNVSASMTNGAWQALHCTLFELHTQFADIGPATAEIRKDAAGAISIPSFDLPIQRLSLTKIESIIKTLAINAGPYRVDGTVVNSSVIGGLTTAQVNLSALHLVLRNLTLAARQKPNGVIFKESGLTVDTAGSVGLGAHQSVDLKPVKIATADNLITLQCSKSLRLIQAPTGLEFSCEGLTTKVNLHLLTPLLAVLKTLPPTDQLNGLATLIVQASGKGQAFAVNTHATISNYQLIVPGSKVQLAPTNISLDVVGQGNLQTHTFACLSNCGLSEQPPAGGAGNSVVINKGSTLAWGPGGNESVTGAVHYDLQRLQTLLSPWLPAGLVMRGQEVMPLAISGPWAGGTGLRQFRQLTVATTAFAFQRISIDGINLGPGQIAVKAGQGVIHLIPSSIPANHGTINLAGIVDLNRKTPAYVLNKPLHLVNNMELNTALGSSVLKFLPISWGMSFKPVGGVAKVSGLLNLSLNQADIPLSSARLKEVGTLAGTVSATHVSSDSPLYSLIAGLNPQHFFNVSGGGQARLSDSGIRPTDFHLQGGKVYYQHMKVVLVSMGVDFSGWVALNNTLDVDVSATGGGLAVPLPLKITGTTAHPHLKLTGKPLKNIGKDIGNTLKHAGGLLKGLFH